MEIHTSKNAEILIAVHMGGVASAELETTAGQASRPQRLADANKLSDKITGFVLFQVLSRRSPQGKRFLILVDFPI